MREERVAKAVPAAVFLALAMHTMSAPSGEERTLGEAAQVERAAWCCAANVTETRRHVVGVFLTWSWSQQPEGRACAASSAHVDTKGRTPYVHLV